MWSYLAAASSLIFSKFSGLMTRKKMPTTTMAPFITYPHCATRCAYTLGSSG